MRNLKLTLAYDGTFYHGWQVQPGAPTIQGELARSVERLLSHPVTIHGAGRTDAGVHAQGQVAHLNTHAMIEAGALQRGVNALLPADIRVTAVDEAPPGFDARRSALSKTYAYRLWRRSVVSPFENRYVHPVWRSLDAQAMDRAAARFVGVHDFTSFSASSSRIEDRVRKVYEAGWRRESEEWIFTIRANGFLQYMVRTIIGTLIEVGAGKRDWREIDALLEARDRRRAGPSAPPKGLHLMSVEY